MYRLDMAGGRKAARACTGASTLGSMRRVQTKQFPNTTHVTIHPRPSQDCVDVFRRMVNFKLYVDEHNVWGFLGFLVL